MYIFIYIYLLIIPYMPLLQRLQKPPPYTQQLYANYLKRRRPEQVDDIGGFCSAPTENRTPIASSLPASAASLDSVTSTNTQQRNANSASYSSTLHQRGHQQTNNSQPTHYLASSQNTAMHNQSNRKGWIRDIIYDIISCDIVIQIGLLL